jgi:hypothetical protein
VALRLPLLPRSIDLCITLPLILKADLIRRRIDSVDVFDFLELLQTVSRLPH